MSTREKLIQTVFDLAIELYDDCYFSQYGLRRIVGEATQKIFDRLAVEATWEITELSPTHMEAQVQLQGAAVLLQYRYKEDPYYGYEYHHGVRTNLNSITIAYPPDPSETITIIDRLTRIVTLENQKG